MHAWDVLNVVVIVSEDDLISRPDFQFIPPLLSILSLLSSKNHEDSRHPHTHPGSLSSYVTQSWKLNIFLMQKIQNIFMLKIQDI